MALHQFAQTVLACQLLIVSLSPFCFFEPREIVWMIVNGEFFFM